MAVDLIERVRPNVKLRYFLIASAVLFQLVGLGVLILCIWLKVDNRLRIFLSERYQQVKKSTFQVFSQSVNDLQWSAPTLYATVYVCIALSCLLTILGCLGCCAIVANRAKSIKQCLLIAVVDCEIFICF